MKFNITFECVLDNEEVTHGVTELLELVLFTSKYLCLAYVARGVY